MAHGHPRASVAEFQRPPQGRHGRRPGRYAHPPLHRHAHGERIAGPAVRSGGEGQRALPDRRRRHGLALVAEEKRAWHAGVSFWRGRRDINDVSIGIELVNPGHEFGYRAFPEAQMAALEALAHGILARHPIPPRHVLGHSDIAPSRKQDPGELFDWPRLARAGIGFWPDFAAERRLQRALRSPKYRSNLAQIGYDCPQTGGLDAQTGRSHHCFSAPLSAGTLRWPRRPGNGRADRDPRARNFLTCRSNPYLSLTKVTWATSPELDRPSERKFRAFDSADRRCLYGLARRPDDRLRRKAGEESPGSTEIRCRITSGGGDPRESATETYRQPGLRRRQG